MLRPIDDARHRHLRVRAMEYAAHGWGVVPGSVWDGHAFTMGHTAEKTEGLAPVMLSRKSYRKLRAVRSWWTVAPYSILAKTGEDFDVIEVQTECLSFAFEKRLTSITESPVIRGPFGTRVLVSCGANLVPGLANHVGIEVLPAKRFVPLPPTRLPGGSTTWMREPSSLRYTTKNGADVQRDLAEALYLWQQSKEDRQVPRSCSVRC